MLTTTIELLTTTIEMLTTMVTENTGNIQTNQDNIKDNDDDINEINDLVGIATASYTKINNGGAGGNFATLTARVQFVSVGQSRGSGR